MYVNEHAGSNKTLSIPDRGAGLDRSLLAPDLELRVKVLESLFPTLSISVTTDIHTNS